MKVQINRENEVKEFNYLTVLIGDKEFRISEDKFGNLIINKQAYGTEDGAIVIRPNVQNEVRIS